MSDNMIMNMNGDIKMKKTIHDYFREVMEEPFAVKHRKILRAEDFIFIGHFLDQTENDDPHTRALKINRLYIDKPMKPKTWVWIAEALTWANSRAVREITTTPELPRAYLKGSK